MLDDADPSTSPPTHQKNVHELSTPSSIVSNSSTHSGLGHNLRTLVGCGPIFLAKQQKVFFILHPKLCPWDLIWCQGTEARLNIKWIPLWQWATGDESKEFSLLTPSHSSHTDHTEPCLPLCSPIFPLDCEVRLVWFLHLYSYHPQLQHLPIKTLIYFMKWVTE